VSGQEKQQTLLILLKTVHGKQKSALQIFKCPHVNKKLTQSNK